MIVSTGLEQGNSLFVCKRADPAPFLVASFLSADLSLLGGDAAAYFAPFTAGDSI